MGKLAKQITLKQKLRVAKNPEVATDDIFLFHMSLSLLVCCSFRFERDFVGHLALSSFVACHDYEIKKSV